MNINTFEKRKVLSDHLKSVEDDLLELRETIRKTQELYNKAQELCGKSAKELDTEASIATLSRRVDVIATMNYTAMMNAIFIEPKETSQRL
jgi:hypothetical protein